MDEGRSKTLKTGASAGPMSRHPTTSSCSRDSAKRRRSEQTTGGNPTNLLSKKPRRLDTRSYIALFKAPNKPQFPGVAVKIAKQSSVPTKPNKVKESPFQKLQRLPDGCHCDFDNDHLCAVNKLREFWHRSQGAAFIDDKELVIKTVLFVMSLLPDVCQSFLVITTSSLAFWEAEFKRLAPFINVAVYDGDSDVRKSIQDLKFDTNGSSVMSHVFLAHLDAILEDIETVRCISWEAVIVEYCQNAVLRPLKQLPTDCRIVLLSSPPEDNLLDYNNLVAFLKSDEEDNGDPVDDSSLTILKTRFTHHVAYKRKGDSSNFMEYWVPTYLSKVQLQLYGSILLTNSSILQSQVATDSVGALGAIIPCLWKCCNHPCLVDEFPHNSLTSIDETESIDNRMRASGKLLLFEKMLREFRNKKSRIIVLFQSDGPGENRMGKILEEFVRHRFGPESYEYVQNRSAYSKKQAAMSRFNDRTKGRFVFLIENSACHSTIHLSSIDAVIIYGSDWNPLNDLKALRKVQIESQVEHVNIFRLYTPFTVEEKALLLAKHGMIIDCNIQDIVPSLSHSLLSWGVSFLFSRLDELHQDNPASKSSEKGTLCTDKVISEFLTVVPTKSNGATISKAYMSGEFYSRNITLIGETEGASSLDVDPPMFWFNLLDGKSPCLYYMSEPPQVKHSNLQNLENVTNCPSEGTNKGRRQHRKSGEIGGFSSKISSDVRGNIVSPEITPSGADPQLPDGSQQKLGMGNKGTPKSLHVQFKCELSKLIKVLELPDKVRSLAEQLLEYLLKNHLVVREPLGISHAFNIALCWRAASLLKYNKLDRREQLALAASCLNYEPNEELAVVFYEKLGTLKKRVLLKPTENTNLRDHMFPKQAVGLHNNLTNSSPQESPFDAEQMVSDRHVVSPPEARRGEHPNMVIKKRIDLYDKVFSVREKNIHEKQEVEMLDLQTYRENQVMKLKEVCSLVIRHIQRSGIDEGSRNDQTKLMVQWFTMLMYAFLEHMRLQFNKLEALQSKTWFKERLMKEKLKEEATSGQLDRCLDLCTNLPDSNFIIEEFIHFRKQNDGYHAGKILASGCDQLLDDRMTMEITLVRNIDPSEAISTWSVGNEPAKALVGSGGASASESVYLPENSINSSSDGTELQRACLDTTPACHDLINQVSNVSSQRRTVVPSRHQPAETESTGMLGTQLEQDLHPDMQPSTSLLDGAPQETFMDDLSQAVHLDPAIDQGVEPSGDPHAEPSGTLGIVAAPDLRLKIQSSSMQDGPVEAERSGTSDTIAAQVLRPETQPSVSVQHIPPEGAHPDDMIQISLFGQQSTGLDSQQSVSASLYPPEQEEPAGILDMVAAESFQPSTLMLNQTTEAERAGSSNAGAAQDLQIELLHSTTAHDVPCEETDVSVPQGTTSQQILEASQGANAEREPENALSTLAVHDLWLGIQPSSSMQDQPVEAEGAGTADIIATQDLQSATQPSTTIHHITPEITRPDERIKMNLQPNETQNQMSLQPNETQSQTNLQPNLAPGQMSLQRNETPGQTRLQPNETPSSQLLTEHFSVGPAAFNHLMCNSEPLRNELEKLKHCNTLLVKSHEHKKLLLQTEYNKEMEKLNRKYASLHHKEDSTYHQNVAHLDDIYHKVSQHQLVAENFLENLTKSYASRERSTSPTTGQVPLSSQQASARTSGAGITASPVASLSATRLPVSTSFHSTEPLRSGATRLQQTLPGNLYGATSFPVCSVPLRNGSYGAAGAGSQLRGPAPHLQHPGMPQPYAATVHRDQQQLPGIGPGLASLRHLAAGTSTNPLAGLASNSIASSSARPVMVSVPYSHPTLRAPSLLPGSFPGLMGNFVPTSGTDSVVMAAQQVSTMNLEAASGIWHAGAQIGVANPVPESALETLPFQQSWQAALAGAVLPSIVLAQPSAPNPQLALATSSANPVFMAGQQGASPNPVFHSNSVPLNAPAGIWYTGTQVAVGNQPVLGSALMNAWSAGMNSGEPSSARAQGGDSGEVVVCLSDDEG